MQIFLMFMPALALMFYTFWFEYEPGQQMFYIAIDSLFLVSYSTVLITITLTQREKSIKPRELFHWAEICRCNVASDEEEMYDQEEDERRNLGSRVRRQQHIRL